MNWDVGNLWLLSLVHHLLHLGMLGHRNLWIGLDNPKSLILGGNLHRLDRLIYSDHLRNLLNNECRLLIHQLGRLNVVTWYASWNHVAYLSLLHIDRV